MERFVAQLPLRPLLTFVVVVVAVVLLDPAIVSAQNGLVPCGIANEQGVIENPCGWDDLVMMFNEIIRWLIIISTSVAALLFMYAGFLYLTSRGDESQVKQATTIFTNVAIGFAIMLLAWLFIDTLVKILTGEGISAFSI